MSSYQTLEENVNWLLDRYKQELEEVKKDDNYDDINGDKDTVINDMENVIIELEYLLKLSNDTKGDYR